MKALGRSQINSVGRLKPKNISMLSYNARGLVSSVLELKQCALEYSVDIILVQETYLKPKNLKCCKINNYEQTNRVLQKEKQHCTTDRHLAVGPPDGEQPSKKKIITSWRKVSFLLEETDTPILNNIPDNIKTTDEIDHTIGALTNYIATVVENSSREVPAADSRRKLPEDVRVLLKAKNAAMRCASAYPTCENRSCARALQRKVKARIQEFKNDNCSTFMEDITPSHQAYWKLAKALKSDCHLSTPALRTPDNSFAVDDREKAECLADSIEQQCSNYSIHDAAHSHRIEEEVRMKISLEPKDDLAPVSVDEIQKHIKALKTKKAPGLDGISYKALKKEAVVIGLSKPGKPRDLPASYHPISLLSGLVKLFEKTIKTRLKIENSHFATERTLKAGVPQGSILSPLLYSAYVNDIPRPSNGIQLALFVDDTALYLRGSNFRDTTPRLQRAIDELTRWLRLWRIKANPEKSAAIRFNYIKRKKKFTVPYNVATLSIDNAPIPKQHNYKYLGVTLDKHVHFQDHVARDSKLTKFYPSRLYGMIGRKSKMSLHNKRTLYLMCIRPVITTKPPQPTHNVGRNLRATAGTPLFKKAMEHSIRSAGRSHFRGRKASRRKKYATRIVGQSRAVSISMLPDAFDEDVKAYGLMAVPFLCFFGDFLVRESRTHLCARACGRPIMAFFSSFPIPLARGKLQKKDIQSVSAQPSRRQELQTVVSEVKSVFDSHLQNQPSVGITDTYRPPSMNRLNSCGEAGHPCGCQISVCAFKCSSPRPWGGKRPWSCRGRASAGWPSCRSARWSASRPLQLQLPLTSAR
ncbi:Probable RNA-directed DNA polymerase from transposon BS [Eumeta japonica]|uniref:Probable RNA-directed DNA polymerase from transposon BS n=1 Tax=Eumeta variegata TaxID=151549 RepID=A0A4C1TR45_EUMVA|nr:Probable RNA-directed DNA polymerase from transposon BS [Eumeta japonica]